jgi:hypothetical protein
MREYLERLKQTFDQKGIELEIPAESEFKSDEPTDKAKPSDSDKPVPKAPELIQIGANEPIGKSHDAARTNVFVATETTQQTGNSDVPGKAGAPGKSNATGKSSVKIRFDEQGNLVLESDDTLCPGVHRSSRRSGLLGIEILWCSLGLDRCSRASRGCRLETQRRFSTAPLGLKLGLLA